MKEVKVFATLRDIVGGPTLAVPFEQGQVSDFIEALGQAHPALKAKMTDEHGQLNGVVHVLVNGRNIRWLQGIETAIGVGDEITLIPPSAGG